MSSSVSLGESLTGGLKGSLNGSLEGHPLYSQLYTPIEQASFNVYVTAPGYYCQLVIIFNCEIIEYLIICLVGSDAGETCRMIGFVQEGGKGPLDPDSSVIPSPIGP